MKKSLLVLLGIAPLLAFSTGCRSALPSEVTTAKTQWKSFDEARSSFDRIEPNKTTLADLKQMGYDPDKTPNMKLLNYMDVVFRFVPNASIRVEDLHEAIQACIKDKDACRAYEIEVTQVYGQRYGNVCADMFGFNKKTHYTGWAFKGLVVTKNDVVIYKLWSGQPEIDRVENKRKPLGPFQDLEGVVFKAASAGF